MKAKPWKCKCGFTIPVRIPKKEWKKEYGKYKCPKCSGDMK